MTVCRANYGDIPYRREAHTHAEPDQGITSIFLLITATTGGVGRSNHAPDP